NVDDAGSYVQPRGIDHLHGEVWIDVFGNPCNPAFRTVYRGLSGYCRAVRLAIGTAAGRPGWLGRHRRRPPVVNGNVHYLIDVVFGVDHMPAFDYVFVRLFGGGPG